MKSRENSPLLRAWIVTMLKKSKHSLKKVLKIPAKDSWSKCSTVKDRSTNRPNDL